MADINYEDLQRQLNESREFASGFNSALFNSTNNTGILNNANRMAAASLDSETRARNKILNTLASTAEDLTRVAVSTGANLAKGQTNFSLVKGVVTASIRAIGGLTGAVAGLVPGIGGALSKISETVTEIAVKMAEIVIDQFQIGWDAYRSLADTGTIRNFGDLSSLAASTGLRFEQLAKVTGKYSTQMANYDRATNQGKDGFKNLANASAGIRNSMYYIGIVAEDFTELQLKYIGEQTSLGRTKNRTAAQLAQGTQEYIENLNTQARLFGLSRKEQQQNRDIALSEDKFRAALVRVAVEEAGNPERARKIQDSALNLSNILQKTAPTVAGGIRELFAGRGAATGELSRQLEVQTAGAAGKIALALRLGQIDEYEARNQIIDSIEKQQKKTEHITQLTNDNAVSRSYAEAANLVAQGKLTKEEIAKAKDTFGAVDGQTAGLANVARDLEDASQELQRFVTSSDAAAKAIKETSKYIQIAAREMNNLFNKAPGTSSNNIATEDIKKPADAQKDVRKAKTETIKNASAIAAQNQLKSGEIGSKEARAILDNGNDRDVADYGGRELLEKISSGKVTQEAGNREALEKVSSSRKATPASGITSRGVTGGSKKIDVTESSNVLEFGASSGSKGNFEKLNDAFKARVLLAASDYLEQTGKKIKINSAKRDPDDQQRLYDDYVKRGKQGMPVAPPGRSLHERGVAVDIQNFRDGAAVAAFNNQGLYQRVANDPVHFQAKTGGIFKDNNSSSYEVELHGDEIVADVVDNKIQSPFTSKEKIQVLRNIIAMTNEKLDLMIDTLSSTVGTQRKLVSASI
jgi:hypothetical protein